MAHFIRWLILTLAVWVAACLVPGITFDTWQSLLIAALVLGILNVFVKPLLTLISIPFIVVTLGFFVFCINAFLLKLTSWMVPGFHVAGFWSALGGSLVISVVGFFFNQRPRVLIQTNKQPEPHYPDQSPPPGKGPIINV